MPSLRYCLAPKKAVENTGPQLLCASGIERTEVGVSRTPSELDKHAAVLYDWLEKRKPSRVRMMANWQSGAGVSFVASVHHRAAVCFRYHGNQEHDERRCAEVSLEEFQTAIKIRHSLGSSGIDTDGGSDASQVDFIKMGG